jgi:hypothetical protein
MAELMWHSQTKERDNGEHKLRPKPARQSSTLPESGYRGRMAVTDKDDFKRKV